MPSPYNGRPVTEWAAITQQLVAAHPLSGAELVEVAVKVWNEILASSIGGKPFKIGVDLRPKPQIMAFFLHELIRSS